MTTQTIPAPTAPRRPHLRFRGRDIPVVLPNRRDARLKLSAVIMALQVLGQTMLGFKLSIAQILITIGVSALVEIVVTYRRQAMLVWPASAMLTGNSVAFILRASGTRHGDWWSLHGIQYFVLAALLSLLSKYLIRPGDRHLFNPSNVGLVWCLLVIGPNHVFPQYLWWGPNDAGVALAYAVIIAGAAWILPSVRMVAMALSFLLTFAVLVGIFALNGNHFFAIWHEGPVEGLSYWANLALSPEVLIFVFFMMSDPQTAPRTRLGRILYGGGTALLAAGLLSFQTTEFAVKLAVLSSLTVTCALVPFMESLARRVERRRLAVVPSPLAVASSPFLPRLAGAVRAVRNPAIAAAVIIAVAAPANTAALAGNEKILLIEKGLAGKDAQ
ncbi:MAG TPA: RnfABCDGE type electron transport complex subunit D [Acidimicrobiales bacterium]|nr:RnfABCDGE type electron transport complex subunit D [Acidimicrobiales bacterium]